MKGLKKKILIALLAATCLTAGAIGLSACGGNKNANDSALYAIYLAETNNGASKTYEQWLKDKFSTPNDGQTPYIGENGNWWIGTTDTGVKAEGTNGADGKDGKSIESIKTIGGEFIVFYTDGSYELIEEADNLPFKLLKVSAKDQINSPVANVYLRLYYYDENNYVNVDVATAVTDKDGVAKFLYAPEDGCNYRVSLTDHGAKETDHPYPEGYEIQYPVNEQLNMPLGYFSVIDSGDVLQTVTATFKDISHSFSNALAHNKIVDIPYTREYSETAAGNAVETNGTEDGKFKVTVKAGYHTYLSFLSYVSPSMTPGQTQEEKQINDLRLKNATIAATGKYKFSISGGVDPVLYYYDGNVGSMAADEKGVPSSVIYHTGTPTDGNDTSATNSNNFTVNFDTTAVRGTLFFGLYSDSDCTVTLTVERTDDAEEIPTPELVAVSAPTNLSTWKDKETNETLTLMPVTGAYQAVLGDDGYYHVNSKNGPYVTVMLTKAVSRYLDDLSLEKYPTGTDLQEAVLYFNPTDLNEYFNNDKRYPLKKYDYNAVLAEYCKYVNKDGLYGVDENLHRILTGLAGMAVGVGFSDAAEGYQWLLPCYYYEPAGGITAPGSGTTQDPFVLNAGKNKVSLSGLEGAAVLQFSVSAPGVYEFKTSATLTVNGCATYKSGNSLYVCITEAGAVTITLTGMAASYTIDVFESKTIEAFVGDASTPSQGVSADTAINIVGSGVYNVVDQKSTNDGVYISFSCDLFGNGTYVLTVYGDDGAVLNYGSVSSSTITINAEFNEDTLESTQYGIYIKASETTNLMLVITKQS